MEKERERFAFLLSTLEPDSPASGRLAQEILSLAELMLAPGNPAKPDAADWQRYLDSTGSSQFLQKLPDREHRYRWAETAFKAIPAAHYTLESMLRARIRRHPDRPFFRKAPPTRNASWSYAETARRLRLLAGLFCSLESDPRVAIFAQNGLDTACCDLACLVHHIFDTPLSVHFDAAALTRIFNRLSINIAVTDTDERALLLAEVRSRTGRPFHILQAGAGERKPFQELHRIKLLDKACAQASLEGLDALLAVRRTISLSDVATVMFTSGSTGTPKGIAFTHYQLVTKRFACAAALPKVGNDEVLLCYLPLYHAFGRYLELLGTLYWGGTYVFAGNVSFETLAAQLSNIRPTGIISIPLRLAQIRDYCVEKAGVSVRQSGQEAVFRSVVGDRLRWGLSNSGHLNAEVFRFFQRLGVDLCSGFGMTQGTGGITMTPPGEYLDDTVGIPLPGIKIRFGGNGELEVGGPYIARSLEEEGRDLPPQSPDEDYWLPTGDLFLQHENGYLQIVDRIKDIYKNSRGQTIAPRRIERKFTGVAGIKHAFLVGDGRDANALLLVPDISDPVLDIPEAGRRAYFNRIVSAANADLPPYERVVNLAVLDRDFSVADGELTPEGSYRRRQIENNFAAVIDQLYQSDYVELAAGNLRVRIPRWIYRNLGLLENDIQFAPGGLHIEVKNRSLALVERSESGAVLIGDLEYRLSGPVLDLGWFARQPKLWVGNPSLVAFCPCRDGWDLDTPAVSDQVRLPADISSPAGHIPHASPETDDRLRRVHRLCSEALFGSEKLGADAVGRLSIELRTAGDRLAHVIRARLEALAWHPAESVRCLAYRVLLTDQPMADYSNNFPAFVASGLPFLNEASIREIANAELGDTRLRALRQRLFNYRTQLRWPAETVTRDQFIKILDLLVGFARRDPTFFGPIRSELANWALHRSDPHLAAAAGQRLADLTEHHESDLVQSAAHGDLSGKIVLDDSVPAGAVRPLGEVLADATFLKQSIMLAFAEGEFDCRQVSPAGIWISRILSKHPFDLFRASVNLLNGKHFDLLLVMGEDFSEAHVRDTIYWLMALSDHPSRPSALPRFGAFRPDLRIMSVAYVSDLTVWDKIREYGALTMRAYVPKPLDWRRLFVRGMAAFFTLWRSSGSSILPGAITPANVVVSAADFLESSCILSLTGWKPYENPLSLILPLVRNFYRQTISNYPNIAAQLSLSWIFDACMESLGLEEGTAFLDELETALHDQPETAELSAELRGYRKVLSEGRYQPLPLFCARQRYQDWEYFNPHATQTAREEEVEQLFRLYRIDRFPEILRYQLYRHTYFSRAEEAVLRSFDRLLERMFHQPAIHAVNLEELSDLQATLREPLDREVFSRIVFPRKPALQGHEVPAMGTSEQKPVMVHTEIADKQGTIYPVREPVTPAEIGHLYRLFRDSDYPAAISEREQHLIVTDPSGQVVAGIRYLIQDESVAYLNGIVVAAMLKGQGIAGALLEDFCARMSAMEIRLIKTDFLLRSFLTAHGFDVHPRWGGLVRLLH